MSDKVKTIAVQLSTFTVSYGEQKHEFKLEQPILFEGVPEAVGRHACRLNAGMTVHQPPQKQARKAKGGKS